MAEQNGGRPEPPSYHSLPSIHREAAIHRTALGVITPDSMPDSPPGEVIETAFADYDSERPAKGIGDPNRGAMYCHTEWLSRDRAVAAVDHYPEMGKYAFYPPDVAAAIDALPGTVRVVLGRERVPVVYVWTDRPPLVSGLKDAGYNGVIVEVVENFPQASGGKGKSALAFDGRAGEDNDWYLVRVSWQR